MYYLLAPVYKFSGPVPFSGNKLYNPYQSIDSSEWRKYNFQVQSKAWLGITDGRKNSNELIDSVYKRLGYDHVSTSDYQKINTFGINNPAYIPTYEHGYNIFKTHQVCIDTDKVLWIDLMFGQTLSMKQWILDKLSEHAKIVALAHPVLRDGYSLNDMKYLTNYDAIEVLNNMRVSVEHWDAALSSGQIAYIISNDDAHDVMNTNHVGRRFTMINSPTLNREIIVSNLKKGTAYGMDFFRIGDEPFEDKIERSLHIPKLTSAEKEPAQEPSIEITKKDAEVIDLEKKKKFDLLDKFITTNPKIVPNQELMKKVVINDSQKADTAELATETLAKVYLEQKKYKKAIQAYKILSLKYPEKSGFFADQIRAVKQLQKEKN